MESGENLAGATSPSLPKQASVVVIGGGVIGCSILYHLAKEGVSDAVLLERNSIASGTTWHSAAQVRALRSSQNLTRLIRYSIELYAELEKETGQSAGWKKTGSLSIACTPDRLIHLQRQERLSALYGVAASPLTAEEAKERWPLLNHRDVIGATWSPDDGRASPSDLCSALLKGARHRSARVFDNMAVQALITQDKNGGAIVGVETAQGMIRCDAVVICTGLWSRNLLKVNHGGAPLWACEHFYLLTMPLSGVANGMPTLSDHDSHLYIRDESGGLLIGCFEPHARALSQLPPDDFAFQLLPDDWEHFSPMMERAVHRVPALADAGAKTLINGPESFTPDGMFLLGETANTPNLFLACGMNSVGVASAGGVGLALAQRIVHGRMPFALPEADPARFSADWNSAAALSVRAPEVLGRHYEIAYPYRQMATARNIQTVSLHTVWQKQQAHFGQYGEWERPLYFNHVSSNNLQTFSCPPWHQQVAFEVMAAHQSAAVFDVSTLGKIDIHGKDAESYLDRILAGNMRKSPNHAMYSCMLNDAGGIESALFVLRFAKEHYRLYTGTSAVRCDMRYLQKHVGDDEVVVRDETKRWATLALCGAHAMRAIQDACDDEFPQLAYFAHVQCRIGGCEVCVVRMSYVGEYGYEITCAVADAPSVWYALQKVGVKPAGLFAQTSMRIEKKFLSYGHDIDSDLSPIEAGLVFTVDWDSNFIGRESLLVRKQKECLRIAAVLLDDESAVPIGGEPLYIEGQIIGRTTSASFGFRVQRPVALALLTTDFADDNEWDGCNIIMDIAGVHYAGVLRNCALFDADGVRMKTITADK